MSRLPDRRPVSAFERNPEAPPRPRKAPRRPDLRFSKREGQLLIDPDFEEFFG